MRYKRLLELDFMTCKGIWIFCMRDNIERMTNICSFYYIYRTRTPLIRVTYFSDFVNRFLKNIFEKILQKSIAICEDVCYNKA